MANYSASSADFIRLLEQQQCSLQVTIQQLFQKILCKILIGQILNQSTFITFQSRTMKRRQLEDFTQDTPLPRKRFAKHSPTIQTLPFSRCLLSHWQLTKEAAQYLSIKNKVGESVMCDKTNPQMALMVYKPNMFQKIIDEIWQHSPLMTRSVEPMDIQSMSVVIT